MGYFKELPDAEIQSFLKEKKSSTDYLLVKNLFRRVKLREDLQNIFTLFNKYIIPEGARPDTVAYELYGSSELDWVVLITAGIINVRNDWPLSDRDLYEYAYEKYGAEINAVKFYETTEVEDSLGRLILPAGKVVDANFNIQDPDQPGVMLNKNPIIAISNYEYEVRINNDKREIFILRPDYLQDFLSDSRKLMLYTESSTYVTENLIRTENTRVTDP